MQGIVYLASGVSYVRQAEKSATSVKEYHPNLPITIYTDDNVCSDVFDNVKSLEQPIQSMGESVLTEEYIPYDRNIYLDTDTYVAGDITDLFDLLDEFDLALAETPGAGCWNQTVYQNMEIDFPSSFPEFNSGVIAYTNGHEIKELFDKWNALYRNMDMAMVPYETNQPALRAALYHGDVRFVTLRNEYNFQVMHHRYARGKIKIVHNSGDSNIDMDSFVRAANRYEGSRAITFDTYPCRIIPAEQRATKYKINRIIQDEEYRQSLKRKMIDKYKKDGIISLLRAIVRRVHQ